MTSERAALLITFANLKQEIEDKTFLQLEKIEPALIRQVFEKLHELEELIRMINEEMWINELENEIKV